MKNIKSVKTGYTQNNMESGVRNIILFTNNTFMLITV